MLATQYAEWHGIEAQADGESGSAFAARVSGELRNQGCIIEAHEVHADKRYDDDESTALGGIMGAMTMALQGKDYGTSGSSLVDDEIASGVIIQSNPKPKMSEDEIMIAMALFG